MKRETFKKPRGFQDILPEQAKKMQEIYNIFAEIANSFNCWEIKLPLLEDTNLFKRSLGLDTDVVTKEMYTFDDLSLRPEMTAQTVRLAIENNVTGRFFYYGECFRYERPQQNRYRQFYTLGVEFLDSKNTPMDDLEMLNLLNIFFTKLNIKYKIYVNCIGYSQQRALYLEKIKNILQEQYDSLSQASQDKFNRNNIWRILDSKEPEDQEIINNLPPMLDYIDENSKNDFKSVCDFLEKNNFNWEIKTNLVRGLDYYNGLVFECVAQDIDKSYGKNLAICGGGRYDGLFSQLNGKDTKSVGFGIGFDRIIPLSNIDRDNKKKILCNFIDCSYESIICKLRTNYVVNTTMVSMKKLFQKYSNDYDYFIIFADEWKDAKRVIIKDLKTGEQIISPIEDAFEFFNIK